MRAAPCLIFVAVVLAGPLVAGAAEGSHAPEPAPVGLAARLAATPEGGELVLPEGVFDGGMVILRRVRIVGAGADRTRIVGQGGLTLGAVVDLSLEGLSVEGGSEALRAEGGAVVTLSQVTLRAKERGLSVRRGALVRARALRVECVAGQGAGVALEAGSLDATGLEVGGPCRRAVDASASVVVLHGASLAGSTEAGVRVVDGAAELDDVRVVVEARNEHASGVFGARSSVRVRGLRCAGGEHGVLMRGGRLEGSDLRVEKAQGAGIALNGTRLEVDGMHLTGPFQVAGLLVSERSDVAARHLVVDRAGAGGLLAVRARIELDDVQISGTRCDKDGDFGHAVALNHTLATLTDVRVTEAEAAAVYVSESNLTLRGLEAARVRVGLAGALGAHVAASGVRLAKSCGAGVVAWQRSTIDVADGALDSTVGSVACTGATVKLGPAVVVRSAEAHRTCADADLATSLRSALPAGAP